MPNICTMKYFYKNINGKKKRISQEQFIAENINDIEPQKLNAKGREIYSKIAFEIEQAKEKERRRLEKNAKISEKAKKRLRNPNGSFLTPEDKRRLKQVIREKSVINPATGKKYEINELTQEELNRLYNLPVFFTVNSMSIIERINENKMNIFIDGVEMNKEQAVEAVNLATNANFEEWGEKVSLKIYGFVYDCEWHPKTRELYISTVIESEGQILLSNPKTTNGKEKDKNKGKK